MSSIASKTAPSHHASSSLDQITASLVARQSRSDDGSMSVPDQIAAMSEWATKQNPPIIIGNVYEEPDVSGRKPLDKRKGLRQAVADVESGRSQMVLTAYFDRFVRSVVVRAEVVQRVEAAGGVVMTLDMGRTSNATAMDKLSGTMLAAIAEFYADQIGEKLVSSKQRNIDKGVPPFPRITPAYQRRDDGTLEQSPFAPLIKQAIEKRLSGASLMSCVHFLREHGLEITHTGFTSMLRSPLLKGEIHFGSFTPNLNAIDEPLISAAQWRKLQSMSATKGRYAKSDRLLARQGVLRCATCESRMSIDNARRGPKGERYGYYRCGNRLCDAPAVVSCEVADAYVRDRAIEYASELEGSASAADDLEAARVRREAAEQKLHDTILTLSGLGTESATREVLDELQVARDRAVADHEHLLRVVTPDEIVRTVDAFDELTLDERRDLIRAVVARALVAPGRGPDRITAERR